LDMNKSGFVHTLPMAAYVQLAACRSVGDVRETMISKSKEI
jgi:hypothetical protein